MNYSVLVNSCDKYETAWFPFFSLLKKNWSNLESNVYLNTETKKFHSDIIDVITINNANNNWGKRLANTLDQINTKYVICLLEDFFIQQKVNINEIELCIQRMEKDSRIAVFYFNRITGYTRDSAFSDYYEMFADGNSGEYLLNCQAALWRKDVLKSLVQKCDNPWEFEMRGYEMNKELIYKYSFFCSKSTRYDKIKENDVFPYLVDRSTGYGIWRGKWLWNNKRLFESNNIKCDFSALPTMSKLHYHILQLFELIKNPFRKMMKLFNLSR